MLTSYDNFDLVKFAFLSSMGHNTIIKQMRIKIPKLEMKICRSDYLIRTGFYNNTRQISVSKGWVSLYAQPLSGTIFSVGTKAQKI